MIYLAFISDSRQFGKKVCEIFSKIDVDVQETEIEATHRLKNSSKTIVKLSKRKTCMKIMKNKRKLKDISSSDFGFQEDSKIYINDSLCGLYKKLWSKSKLLYNKKIIIIQIYNID